MGNKSTKTSKTFIHLSESDLNLLSNSVYILLSLFSQHPIASKYHA